MRPNTAHPVPEVLVDPREPHQYPIHFPAHHTCLNSGLLPGQLIVLINIYGLPRIANPNIANCASSQVPILGEHVIRQAALLLLVLVL